MPTANERLQSRAISHAVDFSAFSNNVSRRMIALLNRVDADLADRIRVAAETANGSVTRLEGLLGSVRGLNTQIYNEIGGELRTELQALTTNEVEWQENNIRVALGETAAAQVSFARVNAQQVYVAALARPFQGRLLNETLTDLEANRARRVRDTIREGFVAAQTPDQIVRTLRGTRAQNYADGLLETDRRHLRTITNTALGHFASAAHEKTISDNAGLFGGKQWISTLDTNTTKEWCVPRDGQIYTLDNRPVDHPYPWLAGPKKLHWNCRSTAIGLLKSADELGVEVPDAQRASLDGQVPSKTTYGKWLRDQPRDRVDEVLGKRRADLFVKKKLDIDKFYNRKGRLLSLDELRDRGLK